ncbi:MAG: hypothetical protein A3C93_01525 [Candidatus Lloydbacteria bacterium RIFCSPHIGHO2_02_FULL_54_17]|uniref:DUF11 domain-containing protein n=1 Tax=Candidatus Lloydbacteria bacterium RIFCSPHIGHO2_02_FULL_54_17 TaxID=1798664 RepID=A0A1G2DBK5_9BACT|nr:MAG: hypothetical protein A3C93_01525 [Candidatus Lloydbacteria bacterium RIFCSPHIGHO2_02_FULL_54_17]OGZ13160.1 MAG: hypothetical protein A2948_02220 [Candidatus Lloydbacteria bacterium RIFCSPLOWO2_01_FULL_54_18]
MTPSEVHIAGNWAEEKIEQKVADDVPKKGRIGALKWIVIVAVLTLLSSGGYLLYQYFDPFARPSEKNIKIALDLPVGATPGIPTEIVVHVTNNNRVPLEYAALAVVFPSGTRSSESVDKDLVDEKKILGTVKAGEVIDYRTTAIFLGEENMEKEISANLEFRFAGINSVFTKKEGRSIRMLSAPINLTVNVLKEINAGQSLELAISALSNTVIPLRDVFIKIEYPVGFSYSSAEPKPDFGANIWRVGTLAPSGKFTAKISGVLSGEDAQEKVFHTSVGVGSDQTARDINTLYSKVVSAVKLTRSFIGIKLSLNGKPAGDVPVSFGKAVSGAIAWRNNLDSKVERAQIEVKLRGVALNRTTIKAENGGFYRSSDDTIIWESRGNTALAVLEAGESGAVGFSFQPLPPVTGNQLLVNPTITAEVTVRGDRLSETGVPEEIKSVMIQSVRVSSEAQFASRAVYYVGPFVNSGPIPPRVEQETTYTIIWSIVNTSNTLTNAEVRAVLPIYMKWYGSVSPSSESVVYNRNTNEIIWSPGEIPAGTGVGKPPREVAFQVVLTPSYSQLDIVPPLITGTTFTGSDTFTGVLLKQEKDDVNTNLSTDPRATGDSGTVTQ